MAGGKRTAGLERVAGVWLAACVLALSGSPARAQTHPDQVRTKPLRARTIPDRFLPDPSVAPSWSIPVDPLGFSPPSTSYLGTRYVFASLDFIGEDKLLFTFRVPGLLHRDAKSGNASDERQVRAVVLDLPQGNVEAETVWTLHDRTRYVWMLGDGHFLLRDRNSLQVGDQALQLKPFLEFPGPLLSVSLDPEQQFLVTNSHEPPKDAPKSDTSPSLSSGASGTEDGASDQGPDTVVRILRRDSGKVILVSRTRSLVDLSINSSGYVENLRGQGWTWKLSLTSFDGGTRDLGSVDSRCDPDSDFVQEKEILVTTCDSDGGQTLVAMTTSGHSLWADQVPSIAIWPEITMAPGGQRIARATLGVTHSVNTYDPIDPSDIKGQWVTVYDAATGDLALETPASPALDSGGNVAISPSGRRVAVLNAGAIQVFELPAAPPLPSGAGQ
jgi:hypothetical protein